MLLKEDYDRVCEGAHDTMTVSFRGDVAPPLANSWPVSEETSRPEPDQYREYCNVDPCATILVCTIKISKLANKVAKALGFRRARVLSFKQSQLPPMRKGYVSWLYVVPIENAPPGKPCEELVVTYDVDRLERVAPLLNGVPDFIGTLIHTTYAKDKCLAKAVLHEIGHAVLHMESIRKKIKDDGIRVTLNAEHEREAWLYSSLVWGLLTGAHSVWCRSQNGGTRPDEGYLMA